MDQLKKAMKVRICIPLIIGIILLLNTSCTIGQKKPWEKLPSPDVNGKWVQPVQGKPAQPVWGHTKGLRVGIAPMPGPRGLLRIYTPYLGHKDGKMINFIALEPIPAGGKGRGLSELEMSALDSVRGKRFWSANDSLSIDPLPENFPARGVVKKKNGMETLTVFIFSEPFENGAKVYVKLIFFEDRPYEVELTTYSREDSKELDSFIITATMGNYARLRNLHLGSTMKSSLDIWPEYNDSNFAPHERIPLEDMIKDKNGNAYFVAAPNEAKPEQAEYASDTNDHWKYYGKTATQYWYKENPAPQLQGLVNGRYTYWASKAPIPGGISFENFELKEPFKNGAKYVFGVTPESPGDYIARVKNK